MALSIGFFKIASIEQKEGESVVVLVENDEQAEYDGGEIEGSFKLKLSQDMLEHIEAYGGPLRPGDKLDINLS
jgi:hypothetical protein